MRATSSRHYEIRGEGVKSTCSLVCEGSWRGRLRLIEVPHASGWRISFQRSKFVSERLGVALIGARRQTAPALEGAGKNAL